MLPFDPFQNNQQALNNSLHENIYVLGNVFPTTYSLEAVEQMGKVMAQNIIYKILGVRKQVLYKGQSAFKIWTSETESISIHTDYNGL